MPSQLDGIKMLLGLLKELISATVFLGRRRGSRCLLWPFVVGASTGVIANEV